MKEFFNNLSRATKNVIIGCIIFLIMVIIIVLYLIYSPVELSRDSGRIGRNSVAGVETETEETYYTETDYNNTSDASSESNESDSGSSYSSSAEETETTGIKNYSVA